MERDIHETLVEGFEGAAPDLREREDGALSEFAAAVLAGLARRPRSIPCRFFYDARGSALFEEITELPEYYPTRVETALLAEHGGEIGAAMGDTPVLIEFGSGSSRKTSLLLDALSALETYIPIDVSAESLDEAAAWLSARHPGLVIRPLIADFTKTRSLPTASRAKRKAGFFSGSTIGNLAPEEARAFLANAAKLLGKGSSFLVGVDLKKDPAILIPAYDDAKGVTAAFNLNLLERINRELGGDVDIARFAHAAIYNEAKGRIEMHLRSLRRQTIRVLGRSFHFEAGETIHTENSHKYSVPEFQALADSAGWNPTRVWTDAANLFSLHLLHAN